MTPLRNTMILVTGANGQLGTELRLLAPEFTTYSFLFTDVAELDITRASEVDSFVGREKPGAIINCAAYTAVDKAEQESDLAYLVNATAAGNLARAAFAHNSFLVHISTDYVFDGRSCIPYTENDPTHPVSKYALSKHSGEEQVLSLARHAMIIRTSWLYSEFGNNFVKTILRVGKERGLMNIVYDQTGSPTYARDLAFTILEILPKGAATPGVDIFHYANEGVASWYDFAKAIVEFSGIDCRISPIETKDYPLPAARPAFSVFNKAKIKQTYGIEIPYWRDSLRQCLMRMENQ
jgi:dTDP-4-dehydrorhamnose reductase